LYLPRGIIHHGTTSERTYSSHVTFSNGYAQTWSHLLDQGAREAITKIRQTDTDIRKNIPYNLIERLNKDKLDDEVKENVTKFAKKLHDTLIDPEFIQEYSTRFLRKFIHSMQPPQNIFSNLGNEFEQVDEGATNGTERTEGSDSDEEDGDEEEKDNDEVEELNEEEKALFAAAERQMAALKGGSSSKGEVVEEAAGEFDAQEEEEPMALTANDQIRVLSRHCFLISANMPASALEERSYSLCYSTQNTETFQEVELQELEIPQPFVRPLRKLAEKYPRYCKIEELCKTSGVHTKDKEDFIEYLQQLAYLQIVVAK